MPPTNDFIISPEAEMFLDTAVPNTARIFDYLLGGTINFEADREAAEKLLQIAPSLRKWVRLRRAFIQEAAYTLHNQSFTQFLDLGSGMPTENHLHASVPTANIVYSDFNPVAVSYGQSLFAEFVNIDYIFGDVHHINKILASPSVRRLIDLREKVAIGLNALPIFQTEKQNHDLAQALYAWAHPQSQIFVVFQTYAGQTKSDRYEKALALSQMAGLPMRLYTLDQTIAMMRPWQSSRVQPLTQFLGLPDDFITPADQEGIGLSFYAAFLTKENAT